MEYRYMIYNSMRKEFQFPSICETTEKGAWTCLFNRIGNDARKYRFEVRKVEKEFAYKMVKEMKFMYKCAKVKTQYLEYFSLAEIAELLKENERRCNQCIRY